MTRGRAGGRKAHQHQFDVHEVVKVTLEMKFAHEGELHHLPARSLDHDFVFWAFEPPVCADGRQSCITTTPWQCILVSRLDIVAYKSNIVYPVCSLLTQTATGLTLVTSSLLGHRSCPGLRIDPAKSEANEVIIRSEETTGKRNQSQIIQRHRSAYIHRCCLDLIPSAPSTRHHEHNDHTAHNVWRGSGA